MRRSDAVFVGTVVGFTDEGTKSDDGKLQFGERVFRFRIDERLTGSMETEVNVTPDPYGTSCYVGFTVGEKYLIYATKRGKVLYSGMCTRSGELKYMTGELLFLRSFLSGTPEPRIYGAVRRSDVDPKMGAGTSTVMPGLKVTVEREGKKYETISDKNGLFRFDQLPDGEYRVKVDAPPIYENRGLDTTVTLGPIPNDYPLQNAEASFVDFVLRWDNWLKGKILDAEGKPIKRAIVRLVPAERAGDELTPSYEHISDYLGDDGRYDIWSKTPGKYVLTVELLSPFGAGSENFRQYYANSMKPDKADVLEVGPTDKRTLDVRLSALVTRTINGTVSWPDGSPVEGGNVLLSKFANEDDPKNVRYDVDTMRGGRFSIQAFEGGEYWLIAGGNGDSLRAKFPDKDYVRVKLSEVEAKPVLVKVTKDLQPINITIPFPRSVPARK